MIGDRLRGDEVRAAELAATLCLATDLGMGFPFEHGLHGTLIAMRLAERLCVEHATASQTFYASLLMYSGCTADAEITAETFGGSLTAHFVPVMFGSEREMLAGVLRALPDARSPMAARAAHVVRRLPKAGRERRPHVVAICEVARTLAARLGLPAHVQELFDHLTERWDGKGPLRRAGGEDLALALRIVHVARDAAYQRVLGGEEQAARVVQQRAGHAFDPEVATCLVEHAGEVLSIEAVTSAWDEMLAREPAPPLLLRGDELDVAVGAIADFTDLVSPYLAGHSRGVAELAAAAGARCGLDDDGVIALRRAGLVHDVGRVAADPAIWQKRAQLTADDREQVRLHAYHTGRVLSRSPFLSSLAPVASAHHERVDGSGYHRGASGAELPLAARLVAAADVYHAMVEPRPHRPALSPLDAAGVLSNEAREGRLDADAVRTVLDAAGHRPARIERPAGLTDREVEVLRMLARGLQTKQVARVMGISVKTADRHVQNAYRKIRVSTRAAATLFAMQHGFVAWGELPGASRTS